MNNMNMQDTQYFEPDERFAQKLDFNMIIMRQIDKVRSAGSVEWMGGYWERKPFSINGMSAGESKVYIPDTREVYINSVETLFDLLLPYFDDTFDKKFKEIEEAKTEFFNNKVAKLKEKEKEIEESDKTYDKADRINELNKIVSQRILENDVKSMKHVFWELLRLIKRVGLIDNAGVREEM